MGFKDSKIGQAENICTTIMLCISKIAKPISVCLCILKKILLLLLYTNNSLQFSNLSVIFHFTISV